MGGVIGILPLSKIAATVRRRWKLCSGGALAIVAAAVIAAVGASSTSQPSVSNNLVGTVKRGELVVSITERGDVEADRKKIISNEVRWPVIIQSVVPDGTIVKEGDVIIGFTCKELSDELVKQKQAVSSAENLYIEATETLKLKEKDLANKTAKAQEAIYDAEQDLLRYQKGEFPVKLAQAKNDVDLAKRDLTLAQGELDFMLKVNEMPEMKDDKPYSEKDIQAKNLEVDRKSSLLEAAINKLEMLKEYDDPKELRRINGLIRDAKMELDRATIEEKTQILVAKNTAETMKVALDFVRSTLDLLLADDAKMIVKADRSGLVIYKTTNRYWDSSKVQVAVSEKINPNQQLMIIPDMASLQISTKVNEALKDQVTPGLQAFVRLDAKSDTVLEGKVTKIAPVPDQQSWWASRNTKVYTVTVKLDEKQTLELKPELTAKVEVVLARLADVVYVPIASVFSEQEQTFCWQVVGGKPKKVPVKVGRMNDTAVQIISGLAEGDKVLLAPPSDQDIRNLGGVKGSPKGEKAKAEGGKS